MKRINLIPEESRKVDVVQILVREVLSSKIFYVAVAMVTVFVLIAIWQDGEIRKYNKKMLLLQEEYGLRQQEIAKQQEKSEFLDKKIEQLDKLKKLVSDRKQILEWYLYSDIRWSGILAEISRVVPEGLTLNNLSLKPDGFIFKGTAQGNEIISKFMQTLDNSPYFEGTRFIYTEKESTGEELVAFQVETVYSRRENRVPPEEKKEDGQ
ncbi:MAG: PilN domain-containing protein [Candidatus Omnitrophica bacterium]|nr:PilN domain-containing protein [Candidatus Omnitrophota bacterium]MDD5488540.1 PilN domain-containing protein [Candidatus Omnitrophota bacterium]